MECLCYRLLLVLFIKILLCLEFREKLDLKDYNVSFWRLYFKFIYFFKVNLGECDFELFSCLFK